MMSEVEKLPRNLPINWFLIGQAVEFYKSKGYTYTETPWLVPRSVMETTLPAGKRGFSAHVTGEETESVSLVGSAEQGFLWMAQEHALEFDRTYVSVSPCFRDDAVSEGQVSQTTFMKVELFTLIPPSCSTPDYMDVVMRNLLADAQRFMSLHGGVKTERVLTAEGEDLVYGNYELGSYGIRSHDVHTEQHHGSYFWVYGTGLAEPRFSVAKERHGK